MFFHSAGKPHLYVVGIQELIELNPGQVLMEILFVET